MTSRVSGSSLAWPLRARFFFHRCWADFWSLRKHFEVQVCTLVPAAGAKMRTKALPAFVYQILNFRIHWSFNIWLLPESRDLTMSDHVVIPLCSERKGSNFRLTQVNTDVIWCSGGNPSGVWTPDVVLLLRWNVITRVTFHTRDRWRSVLRV
jgi:hypothetical protein